MFPLGPGPLRVGVFGNGSVESSLSDADGVDRPLDIEPVEPATVVEPDRDQPLHCVVVESASGVDCAGVVEECAQKRPELPVVAVTDGAGDGAVEALEAGADETLPAAVTETAPELVAERVVSTVERERARDGMEELYDGVAGGATLHDPETAELLRANRWLCEALGYDREELEALSLGDLTADVPGYDGTRARAVVEEAASQAEPVTLEWPFEAADGSVHWTDSRVETTAFGPRKLVLWASTDATERRQLERTYRDVFESVADGLVLHDPDTGKIRDVNGQYCELTGYDREELVGETLSVIVPEDPDDTLEDALEWVKRARESGPQLFEFEGQRKDGTTFQGEVHLSIVDVRGEERVLASVRDVTERKRRERALEEERARYSTLVEQSGDGIVVVQDGEYVFVNDRFCELTGYDREELVGRPFYEVFAGEDRELVRDRYERRVAGESPPLRYDAAVETADGERLTLDVAASRVTRGGDPATLGTLRDVTERRRRERAVRALQDAAETMQEVDTPEAVAETALEATREALDLPLAVCWWHDADAGRLEPAVATDEVHEAGLVSPLSADRYEYEVFRESKVTDYVPGDVSDENPLETGVLLPLGEHGLVAAGRHGQVEYDDTVLDVARSLAEHTTTALDRVERAREVRESERRFQLIADHIDEIVYLATADFSEILYINGAYEEVYGRPVEELSEDSTAFVEAAHPEDRDQYEADVERLRADVEAGDPQEAYEGEYRIRRDGETRWVAVTRFPVAGEDGTVDRIVGRVQDVTERKRREQEYEQVFNGVQDAIVVHDPETGEMVDVNDTFCDLLGYDRETVLELGTPGFSVKEEGYTWDRAEEIIDEVVEEGQVGPFEWKVETADGDHRVLEVVATTAEIGGEQRHVSINRDVTARKRREQEYEQIFNSVNDAIAVFDPETGEITDVNDTYHEMLGYDDLETVRELGIEGLSVNEEGYTGDRGKALVREVAETGDPTTVEWRAETRSGERLWLEATLAPGTVGGADRVLSIQRDVTERKRREQEYEQVFNGVPDPITVSDPETGEMIAVNDAMCETVGYDRETVLEKGIDGLSVTAEGYTGERAAEIIDRVMTSGEPETFEWKLETAGGDKRVLEVTGKPATVGGEERYISLTRDITERKRREREYEQVFNGVTDGIVIFDPEAGELIDVNDTYLEMLGYDDIETIRELGADGLSADGPEFTGERVDSIVERVAKTGETETVEWEVERADGEQRVFEVNSTTATIGGKRHVLSLNRDVTERKRREREYEQIFNGVNDAIAVFDPETGEITDVNDPYREMLGYDDLETIRELGIEGLSVNEEGYTGEQGKALVREVAETGDPTTVEWRAETRSGEPLWLEVTLAPGEIGGEDRVLSIQRDVTERKRREQEYEQVFNSVTDGIAVHDPETVDEGAIVDINETMCELTGYDRETLLEEGGGLVDVPGEGYSSQRASETIREVMATGEAETFEWLIERKDGQRRWLEVKATPARLNGERRCLSLMRDVTDQRRTERRLEEILDRIDEAIFMTRAEEVVGPSQAPDYVSSGYEEVWGQSIETIRETYEDGFFDTLHPEDEAEYRAVVERVVGDIESGTAADRYAHEYRIERPDGERRWVHSDYYPTEWEGSEPRLVVVSRDVTERKARERRVASFDDATEDLATADTPPEATRTAVEAARETLELPAVGAFLYDDDEGVLRPAVTAGPLPDAVAEPVGPGDGPLWEGFATGAIVAPDGGDSPPGLVGDEGTPTPTELSDLAGWRALALGNHGVLLVGSPDRALESETIQAAHVLAATLEAALNHLEGRQRLEAQQEQLRTQTERAERLDRIARLTQQVEAAITDASTPGEVERAVCRRLAGSGPYDLAWVGGVEVGTDRLAARAVVGAPDQYVGALDLATEGTADPHPAVEAWRTDEVCIADSLVDSGPAGDWRQRALSEGFQSLCAVPLTYDGVTHGVLTVGTDSPNAFGEREREVLTQLGTSIANALAAVERRRALESDETVELEFQGSGETLPFARAAREADCRVQLERTAARQDGTVSVHFSFEGDAPPDVDEVATGTLPGDVDVVADEPSATLVEVRTDDWFGSPLAEYGGVLREASADPDGTTVTVEVPRQADVRSFVERLQAVAPSLDLVARRQHSRQDRTPAELGDRLREDLTDRQLEVLRTALSAGYFEWPREHDGSEVADRLGITQPTLNKHLRLAEKKTFDLLLDPGG